MLSVSILTSAGEDAPQGAPRATWRLQPMVDGDSRQDRAAAPAGARGRAAERNQVEYFGKEAPGATYLRRASRVQRLPSPDESPGWQPDRRRPGPKYSPGRLHGTWSQDRRHSHNHTKRICVGGRARLRLFLSTPSGTPSRPTSWSAEQTSVPSKGCSVTQASPPPRLSTKAHRGYRIDQIWVVPVRQKP